MEIWEKTNDEILVGHCTSKRHWSHCAGAACSSVCACLNFAAAAVCGGVLQFNTKRGWWWLAIVYAHEPCNFQCITCPIQMLICEGPPPGGARSAAATIARARAWSCHSVIWGGLLSYGCMYYVEISFKLYNWRSKLLIFLILTGHIFFDRRASALVFLLLCTLYVSVQFRETTKFLLSYNFSQDISKLLVDSFLKINWIK